MVDVIVVGAGPAGATLARLVGRAHRTLLVERGRLRPGDAGPAPAKCCGGLLAPDAQRALAALGLGVPRDVLAGPQLFAVRAIDVAAGRERHYARSYVNVDRGRFDAWLRSLVPPDVDVLDGSRVVALRDEGSCVAVEVETPGGIRVERARLVVGADGASSRVRRQAFPQAPEPRTYLAVQESFEAVAPEPCYTAIFDPAVSDFYGWAIPKGERLLVGAALPAGSAAPARLAAIVRSLEAAGTVLGCSLGRQGALLHRPLRLSHVRTGSGRIALVGEAAGFVSPSSGEGISWALRSASALAGALSAGIDGWAGRYLAATAGLRAALMAKVMKAPFLFTPALRRLAMASGIGTIAVGEPPSTAVGELTPRGEDRPPPSGRLAPRAGLP